MDSASAKKTTAPAARGGRGGERGAARGGRGGRGRGGASRGGYSNEDGVYLSFLEANEISLQRPRGNFGKP